MRKVDGHYREIKQARESRDTRDSSRHTPLPEGTAREKYGQVSEKSIEQAKRETPVMGVGEWSLSDSDCPWQNGEEEGAREGYSVSVFKV